ncbi:hypothetical protein GMYAFLOJ_CDS0074 [Microbacterium phage phiMiGM15]
MILPAVAFVALTAWVLIDLLLVATAIRLTRPDL